MALTTKQDVKDFLVITDTGKDTIIEALILVVQSFIEEYCHRIFEKLAVTEYYHGGVDRICVKRPPIASSPAPVIYEDYSREYEADDIVDSDDYYIDYDTGIIYFDYNLEKGPGSIKITYTGGYTTIPQAIKQACVELVARKVKLGATGDIGVVSKGTPGGINVTFSMAEILPETKEALDLFRLELSE